MLRIFHLFVLLIVAGSCTRVAAQCQYTYQSLLRISDGSPAYVTDATYSPGQEIIFCGYSNNRGFVAKFDGPTLFRWSKYYRAGTLVPQKVTVLNNGDVCVAGTVTTAGVQAILVMRLNSGGNVVWSKRLQDVSAPAGHTLVSFEVTGIAETGGGDGVAVCGNKVYRNPLNGLTGRMFVFKLGSSGDVQWTRQDTQGKEDNASALLVDGGEIVVVGSSLAEADGVRYAFIQKLDASLGSVNSFDRFRLDVFSFNYFRSIEKIPAGYEISTQAFGLGRQLYYRLRVARDGSTINLKLFPAMGSSAIEPFYHSYPLEDGGSILSRERSDVAQDAELGKLAVDNTIRWNYTYPQPGTQKVIKVLPSAGSAALVIGQSPSPLLYGGQMMIYMLRVTSEGKVDECLSNDSQLSTKDSLSYSGSTGPLSTTPMDFQPPFDVALDIDDIIPMSPVRMCDECVPVDFKILGESLICDPGAEKIYVADVGGKCNPEVTWTLDPAIGTIHVVNKITVLVRYHQAGVATLTANFTMNCIPYTATLPVVYNPTDEDLDLGEDLTLCQGKTTLLSVPGVFTSVEWSNGYSTNSITVSQPGIYKVRVSTDGICFLEDSVKITVNPLPVSDLPKDTVICRPDTKTLTAPPGMLSYLWQDNSNQRSLTVSDVGTYWVRITDINHCEASDTVKIKKLAEGPVAFVSFRDTAICLGERLNLSVNQKFDSYNWNSGQSIAAIFEVRQPGVYPISVVTKDGCKGDDEIIVRDKHCKEFLYVPTAFTPDNNGRNDLFKVTSVAFLDFFDLRVFNRWGELVFVTNDPSNGWDGKVKGLVQPPDAFVWVVRYRFAGKDKEELQKGTVTLIR